MHFVAAWWKPRLVSQPKYENITASSSPQRNQRIFSQAYFKNDEKIVGAC
jgi:hypothetical protein